MTSLIDCAKQLANICNHKDEQDMKCEDATILSLIDQVITIKEMKEIHKTLTRTSKDYKGSKALKGLGDTVTREINKALRDLDTLEDYIEGNRDLPSHRTGPEQVDTVMRHIILAMSAFEKVARSKRLKSTNKPEIGIVVEYWKVVLKLAILVARISEPRFEEGAWEEWEKALDMSAENFSFETEETLRGA